MGTKIYLASVIMVYEDAVEIGIKVEDRKFTGYMKKTLLDKYNIPYQGYFKIFVKDNGQRDFNDEHLAQETLISRMEVYHAPMTAEKQKLLDKIITL